MAQRLRTEIADQNQLLSALLRCGLTWNSNQHLNVIFGHAGQRMTPKTMKSDLKQTNRAQMERGTQVSPIGHLPDL
jgi:hypothetical protein